ncbi:XIAP-associated factor 1 isoform X2 [Tiliqua scincoides]|uniref:XIAP-associated factor 1 isoform X2 n=1 Tax=Tiliqua scincoides TaxID=71010 RepID=UPI0034636F44
MKAKAEEGRARAEEERLCQNCKRDVAAANFPLHEAHCLRFLAVCPHCDERLAATGMQEHLAHAHQQVRCQLCRRLMQQYLLERHQAEECQERLAKCSFCELELPYRKLQAHLDACGSRTTLCWDCHKYVMYKALEEHKHSCQAKDELQWPTNVCQQSNLRFSDERYLLHPNECQCSGGAPASTPTKPASPAWMDAAPGPSSPTVSKSAGRDVRPKRQDKELVLVGRPLMKPPRGKKAPGHLAFTAGPQALDTSAYDRLVTCSQCNILLPGPTLQKHERKCRRAASLQTLRRSPRHSDKGGTVQLRPASFIALWSTGGHNMAVSRCSPRGQALGRRHRMFWPAPLAPAWKAPTQRWSR